MVCHARVDLAAHKDISRFIAKRAVFAVRFGGFGLGHCFFRFWFGIERILSLLYG